MEKITEKETQITVKNDLHTFYCDECGEEIMSVTEYPDGYVPQPTKYGIQHVNLKGDYCKKCAKKRIKQVIDLAKSLDFDIDFDLGYVDKEILEYPDEE